MIRASNFCDGRNVVGVARVRRSGRCFVRSLIVRVFLVWNTFLLINRVGGTDARHRVWGFRFGLLGSCFVGALVVVFVVVDVADVAVELRKLEDVLLDVGNLNDDPFLPVVEFWNSRTTAA